MKQCPMRLGHTPMFNRVQGDTLDHFTVWLGSQNMPAAVHLVCGPQVPAGIACIRALFQPFVHGHTSAGGGSKVNGASQVDTNGQTSPWECNFQCSVWVRPVLNCMTPNYADGMFVRVLVCLKLNSVGLVM